MVLVIPSLFALGVLLFAQIQKQFRKRRERMMERRECQALRYALQEMQDPSACGEPIGPGAVDPPVLRESPSDATTTAPGPASHRSTCDIAPTRWSSPSQWHGR